MPLINEEQELQIEIENLNEKINKLDKLIFGFNKENDRLDEQIWNIEYKIANGFYPFMYFFKFYHINKDKSLPRKLSPHVLIVSTTSGFQKLEVY
ncbi:hypothetical protein [Spiroplasma endosymbiont of Nebria brevicollis]|uniref:hypothetical protein n=1 Tax=Spiroplasma endosymbiont of Nebria brevicollis TaxID=3066284 RepID=UPI00313D6C45